MSGAGRMRHRPVGLGLGRPIHDRLRVEPIRDCLGIGGDPRVTLAVELADIGTQFGVQRPSVLDIQAEPTSCTINVARHSESAPHSSAARVCGISYTSAFAKPECLSPRAGESRRASAISLATPRPCLRGAPRPPSHWHDATDPAPPPHAPDRRPRADFTRSSREISSTSADSFRSNILSILDQPPTTLETRTARRAADRRTTL